MIFSLSWANFIVVSFLVKTACCWGISSGLVVSSIFVIGSDFRRADAFLASKIANRALKSLNLASSFIPFTKVSKSMLSLSWITSLRFLTSKDFTFFLLRYLVFASWAHFIWIEKRMITIVKVIFFNDGLKIVIWEQFLYFFNDCHFGNCKIRI